MPDLLTHLATGHWLGRALSTRGLDLRRRRTILLATLAGAALPDLLTRAPTVVLGEALPGLGSFLHPLHSPIPYVLVAILASRAFVPELRRHVLAGLLAGGLLHLLMDLGQRNLEPGYTLLFPFSAHGRQLGLFAPEASVRLAGWFLAGSFVLEAVLWILARRRAGKGS